MDDDYPGLVNRYRARIEKELAEILALQNETKDFRAPVELDQASVGRLSRMDAMQGQEMAEAAHRRRTMQVERLRRALARMEAGEFAYCVDCGERIPDARLDIDPSNVLCMPCASARN